MALFSKGPGIVYNPKVARLNCVYGGDGGTRSKPEDGCGPKSDFCDAQRSAQDGWCDGRAHSPDRLADILRNALSAAINEVVINTEQIDRQLPTAVDAIFVVTGPSGVSAANRARAERVHAMFLAAYPHLSAETHPLLCLDPTDLERPFRTSDCRRG